MEERALERRQVRRPWWMTPFGREPMGDIWADRQWPEWSRRLGEEYMPSFDLYEKDGKYHLRADLPGAKKEDISVNILGDTIIVSGKRKTNTEEEDANYYFKESSHGPFSRSFRVLDELDEDKVEANFKDGVLRLEMPVKGSSKRKKIAIKG